ncbi:hypothetical protein KM176_00030 [Pseudooceanicola sp. CBS1P-1]|uniref:Uncharacterized protein n=1 Tax=Pseudooceanicola albus TaxID=2692189 RepID=A0A6L7G075_9RHOB|nr:MULTISPECIES: hypothetical protein [Pseudooceanicola]MBT9382234.1 hypothetical protein [Pseudooceanicola endophyticus]MXN16777.1 hypothetical protein [Pseudooceanicola albus]
MANGVTTTNADPSALVDELLGNREGSTVRVLFEAFVNQLLASGALADLDIGNRLTSAETRVTTLEGITFAEAETYADTAAGLAATSEGDFFKVQNADTAILYDVYLHDAGSVATFQKSAPSE